MRWALGNVAFAGWLCRDPIGEEMTGWDGTSLYPGPRETSSGYRTVS
ncbi:hypothetical protein ACWGCI_20255 [Streptomyces sp. NPDC054949]